MKSALSVWLFRRLKMSRSQEMRARSYALHSVCPQLSLLSSTWQVVVVNFAGLLARGESNGSRKVQPSVRLKCCVCKNKINEKILSYKRLEVWPDAKSQARRFQIIQSSSQTTEMQYKTPPLKVSSFVSQTVVYIIVTLVIFRILFESITISIFSKSIVRFKWYIPTAHP